MKQNDLQKIIFKLHSPALNPTPPSSIPQRHISTTIAVDQAHQPFPTPFASNRTAMNVIVQLSCFLFTFAVGLAHPTAKLTALTTAKSTHQISSEVFKCDSSDKTINAICKEALFKFNSELSRASISIDREGVLFKYDDDEKVKIPTGHSCSITAKITRKYALVRFSRGARLNLKMASVTEPFLLSLKLPVKLRAKVDVKQRFGQRILGSCSNYGSDSYTFKGDGSTTASIVIGFTLDPKVGTTKNGDYIVKIKPRFTSVLSLESFNLNFKVSGVNRFSSILTSVTGLGSTLLKSVTALIQGDSVSDIVEKALPFDIGAPIVLGIGALPGPLEQLIWKKLLKSEVVPRFRDKAKKYSNDLQMSINSKLKAKFKLNGYGEKTFIIKKGAISLLLSGASRRDVFGIVPENPLGLCIEKARHSPICIRNKCPDGPCFIAISSTRKTSECRREEEKCYVLENEWKEKYGALKLTHSSPLISQ